MVAKNDSSGKIMVTYRCKCGHEFYNPEESEKIASFILKPLDQMKISCPSCETMIVPNTIFVGLTENHF